ncbi:ribonuclease P protein component [Candidatus Daviesbacteria bacterium]|nr:ribonuclease P protein component [Candidatus Daviesbacteria bacterium]
MLPKSKRLNLKTDFQKIVKTGTRYSHGWFSLFIGQANNTKVGIAVGVKITKKANRRNRMRRLISAACQRLLPKLSHKASLLFIARKDFSNHSSSEVEEIIEKLLQKAHLL